MPNILFVLLRRIHAPLVVLIIVYATSILGFVLIPGIDDQGQPWRMDFLHAFYFVSFMGSTIGFGEIPYAFTGAQRLWATISIYATVTAWLYGIGALLSLIQDSAFRTLLTEHAFRRAVRRIREPFYLVCGYGDTGSLLVRALSEAGIRAVVIDVAQERINALALKDLKLYSPGLCADASVPNVLLSAGLTNPCCEGVVALTDQDHVNLKIAITSRLLNPRLRTIARAETHDAEANIASFGTDEIINPFDTFAGRLALALHSPGMYVLFEWMTGVPHETLQEPLFPPHGRWVLCGYGRFGKAVHERLIAQGVEVTIVEALPELTSAPQGTVVGRGTEAETLLEAGIDTAVGIVAGTDDDANNLSILMTARDLNPGLFVVARQNQRRHDAIFRAAHIDLVMQRGSVIGHKIFALITTPLIGDFLIQARRESNEWANELVSRIGGITAEQAPETWVLEVSPDRSPALQTAIAAGQSIRLEELSRDPRDHEQRLDCIALLHRRHNEQTLLPDETTVLQPGDCILFCGRASAKPLMEWVVSNTAVLSYVHTGEEHPSGFVWQWFSRIRHASANTRY